VKDNAELPTMGSRTILIIYLGRRGGGTTLTRDLATDLKSKGSGVFLICNSKNRDLVGIGNGIETLGIASPIAKNPFEFILRFIPDLYNVFRILKARHFCLSVFTMPSPYDLVLNRILDKAGVCIVRVIHDVVPHEGDFWPTTRTIRRLLKYSNFVITLSKWINDELWRNYGVVSTLSHLPPPQPPHEITPMRELAGLRYLLFFGRIKPYKGLDRLIEQWRALPDKSNVLLVVAGEGKIPLSEQHGDEIFFNRWLSEDEIWSLVNFSDAVVFPYREASQSGALLYPMALGKDIIASDIGGIPEYCRDYPYVHMYSASDPNALRVKIEQLIESGPSPKVPLDGLKLTSLPASVLQINGCKHRFD
jgi:glycosyltransferase involved in cell wall biosynthesis